MIVTYYSPIHERHIPPFEVFNGDHETAQETPDRALNIKHALEREGFPVSEAARKVPFTLLRRTHDEDYLNFLQHAGTNLGDDSYLYPSIHPYQPPRSGTYRQESPIALRGRHIFDTYTPILRHTYEASYQSASLSYTAAQHLRSDPTDVPYALCRPPGHHAEHAMAGGYCYINNAAVAAEYLTKYGKVATLDVDFHHGNGTQHIFYGRDDVLTVSIHADPGWKFPYYSGFKDEIGVGLGEYFNLNIPLGPRTSNTKYHAALIQAIARIKQYHPRYLVVSFGADTHREDPIGGFALTTPYYTRMARTIHALGIPMMVVQEGGYNNEYLGKNVVAFLKGLV